MTSTDEDDSRTTDGDSPEVAQSAGLKRSSTVLAMANAVRQSFKRPAGWVVGTGIILAACAGIVNVVAIAEVGAFVSHVTGTTAKIGMRLEEWHVDGSPGRHFFEMIGLVLSFISGAFLCGLIVTKNEVHIGKSLYGLALLINSGLLVLATSHHLFYRSAKLSECKDAGIAADDCTWARRDVISEFLAAAACGLQNGLCTVHFGAVIRTTHVTGLSTDLGLTLGRMVSIKFNGRCRPLDPVNQAEYEVDVQKLQVFVSIAIGFIAGSVMGAYLVNEMGTFAFLVPAAATFTLGIIYTIFMGYLGQDWRLVEVQRLQDDVNEVDQVLEGIRSNLITLKRKDREDLLGNEEDDAAVQDMDEKVHHVLNVVHEVEEQIRDMMRRKNQQRDEE